MAYGKLSWLVGQSSLTNEQAALLRAGRLSEADIDRIAEEIESMARTEKRELVSRLTELLLYLLKLHSLPDRRGSSWEATITVQRDDLADHLNHNPSLKARLREAVASAYRKATITAHGETDLPKQTFPTVCPWPVEQILDPEFWPDWAN
jgi:hypothetical protein